MNRQIIRTYSIFTTFRKCPTSCCSLYNGSYLGGNYKASSPKSLTQFYRFGSDDKTKDKSLTARQKLKKLAAEYGTTVIVFHVTISLISLGTCYLLISNGVDVPSYMEWIGFSEQSSTKFAAGAGTFVAAYAVHKVFAPVRLSITVISTPLIVRYLRNKGILYIKRK